MLATLESVTDPVALVVGSVEALDADADYLASRARILDASADAVARATPSWSGTASEGWSTRRTELTGSLRAIAEVYLAVADGLRAHASVLFWAQQRAQLAIDLWTRGVATGNAPRRSVPYAIGRLGASTTYLGGNPTLVQSTALSGTVQPLDPGAAAKLEAQDVLANALAAVSTSARTLEQRLDSLSDGLPDGRFNIEDLFAGIGSWFAEIGAMIGKFNAGRLVLDPRGYATDIGAAVTGVEDTYTMITDDPMTAPAKLADLNGLHDNPGHWWGKAGMDVAVAAAGAGATGISLKVIEARPAATMVAARASSAESAIDAVASDLARFPKAAQLARKPDGFDPATWEWREASRDIHETHWWDPEGGEWRDHRPDRWHEEHWDYNSWTKWNTSWEHLYPNGTQP